MISTDLEVLGLEGKTLKLTINPVETSEAANTTWDCKTPTGEEHNIPLQYECPPAPGPRWLLDSLSVKKKASKKRSRCQPKVIMLQPAFNVSCAKRITLPGTLPEDVRASDDALEDHIVINLKWSVEEMKRLQHRSSREKKHCIIYPSLKVAGRRS
ncbi:hypothetical protein NC652_032926 [Populus alba x Populus x berolinensis]|nr:hypothetical protein NC652_032926 [Populus alba x Populus x berolinensis]